MTADRPGVLMVTGAYYPELSGAGLQCRAVVRRLRDAVDFTVLTTTVDRSLPVEGFLDGVVVHRVFIDATSLWSKTLGAARFTIAFIHAWRRFSILHLHGFSQKSMLLVLLALVSRKRIAIKLTSVGHDDPISMQDRGRLAYWCYTRASVFFGVSPRFRDLYEAAGLPASRLRIIPNGVNLERFRPPTWGERNSLRHELEISTESSVVLFVGFFSREKRPDVLFKAWASVARSSALDSILVLVGATRGPYYEVEEGLAQNIKSRASAMELSDRIRFAETAKEIERFYRAADIFVLPSVREGLPNVLLEAMASGVACISTRIENVTGSVIEDGENGLLVPADDIPALANAIRRLIEDSVLASRLGCEARRTIKDQYGLDRVAEQYLVAYRDLIGVRECAV